MIAPVASDPDNALLPLHPFEAAHDVTLLDVQSSVVVPPGATPGGDALSVADAVVDELMLTVTFAIAPPPGPLQFSVYWVAVEIAPVDALPDTALLPLQPPDAVHESALAALHVSIDELPDETLVGFALKLMVGGLDAPPPAAAVPPPEPPPPQPANSIEAITAHTRTEVARIEIQRAEFIRSISFRSVPRFSPRRSANVSELLLAKHLEICWVSGAAANLHILT